MNKVDLECAETVKAKPTGNSSGFNTYSNTINVACIWLDKSVYLIIQWKKMVNKQAFSCFQKLAIIKKLIKVGKISNKDDILKVEEKRVALIGNKTNRSL